MPQVVDSKVLTEKADARMIGRFPWNKKFRDVEEVGNSVGAAMEAANLNWTVRKVRLRREDNNEPVDDYAIVRDDNNSTLSTGHGEGYVPVQNIRKFTWFQPLLDSGKAKILHAGELKNGRKVCIVAKLEYEPTAEIVRGDVVGKYILLSDSFDGGNALNVQGLALRLMCYNGATISNNKFNVRLRHSSNIEMYLDNMQEEAVHWNQGFEETLEQYRTLARHDVGTEEKLQDYFTRVMQFSSRVTPDGKGTELVTRSQNVMDRLLDNFHDTKYNSGHTWWTAYNSVTAYLNHSAGRTQDSALDSLFFGQGKTRQEKALDVALEFALAA